MKLLKLCIGKFKTIEQAQEYKALVKWYSTIEIEKDINTGDFGVYIYETTEFLDLDIEFRTSIFYQDAYFIFGEVVLELN